MIDSLLPRVMSGERLDRREARLAMGALLDDRATPAQTGAVLGALSARGPTSEELVGFTEALVSRMRPVRVRRSPVVDTCGTGGDGRGTFNLSTAAALVAAGAGANVLKHGNRSISSSCGSADLFQALGAPPLAPGEVGGVFDELGLAFCFAPLHHPALGRLAPLRRELRARTVFHLIGPLAHPAGARRRLLGVADPRLLETMAAALAALGVERGFVVCGLDGVDEVSVCAETRVLEVRGSDQRPFTFRPESVGLPRRRAAELAGGSPTENAKRLWELLEGKRDALRDAVALNAAFALVAGGCASSIEEGLARACAAIDDGRAARCLRRYIAAARSRGGSSQ